VTGFLIPWLGIFGPTPTLRLGTARSVGPTGRRPLLQQPEGKTMSLSGKYILRIAFIFSGNRPINFLNLLVTNEFSELMVKETNRYEEKFIFNNEYELSRISNWFDVTVPEMKVFWGFYC
jgi:hypothetical protein